MDILEQIRTVRECKNLSQEEMAKHLNMTISGYSKLERGENRMYIDKLVEIAKILDIELKDLFAVEGKAPVYMKDSPNSQYHNNHLAPNYYYVLGNAEVEKLITELKHKDELLVQNQLLIKQQAEQLQTAQEMIELLKKSKFQPN